MVGRQEFCEFIDIGLEKSVNIRLIAFLLVYSYILVRYICV
jgi:hypothetical protein